MPGIPSKISLASSVNQTKTTTILVSACKVRNLPSHRLIAKVLTPKKLAWNTMRQIKRSLRINIISLLGLPSLFFSSSWYLWRYMELSFGRKCKLLSKFQLWLIRLASFLSFPISKWPVSSTKSLKTSSINTKKMSTSCWILQPNYSQTYSPY